MLSIIKLRRAVLVLGVVAASCAITACGSSSGSTSTAASASGSTTASASSSSSPTARRAAFVACLKQHGVTLPSRPPGSGPGGGPPLGNGSGGPPPGARQRFFNGGGFFGGGGAFRNSKFAAAFRACGAQLGFRGGRPGRVRLSHAAIDKFVACVRQHGYDLPTPNFSGKGPVFPANIRTNKKFQAASRACASLLRPAGAGAGPGTGTTASS